MARFGFLYLVLLFIMFTACACGNKSNDSTQVNHSVLGLEAPVAKHVGGTDLSQEFVQRVFDHSVSQLANAEVAINKSSDDAIVDLAYSVKVDYERVLKEMGFLSAEYDWNLPDVEPAMQRINRIDTAGRPGQDFGKAYVQNVLTAHNAIIDDFETQLQVRELPVPLSTWLEINLVMFNRHRKTSERIMSGSNVLP